MTVLNRFNLNQSYVKEVSESLGANITMLRNIFHDKLENFATIISSSIIE
jgi:hypothetical protein